MDTNIFEKVYHVNINMLISSKYITGANKLQYQGALRQLAATIYTQADALVTIQHI